MLHFENSGMTLEPRKALRKDGTYSINSATLSIARLAKGVRPLSGKEPTLKQRIQAYLKRNLPKDSADTARKQLESMVTGGDKGA